MPQFAFAVTVVIASVLLTSGLAKLRVGSFVTDLANYQLLSPSTVVRVAPVVPWVEIGLGISLIAGLFPRPALALAAMLLSLFSVGVFINLLRYRQISCGCRGSRTPISWRLLATNAVVIVSAGVAAASGAPPVVSTLLGAEADLAATEALAVLVILASVFLLLREAQTWVNLLDSVRRADDLHRRLLG